MAHVVAFWLAAVLVAVAALPFAFRLFRRFPDSGAGLSFPLGLLFLGYGYFMLRVFRILPFGRGGYLLALALLVLLAVGVAGRDPRFLSTLARTGRPLVAIVALFSACFFGYVWFRSYHPDISGTEQPMDLMYLNATIDSPTYPPQDPWMAGRRLSYYYFGYLQVGALTSISAVPASEGYNLGLAYTVAASATAIASLVLALARWVLGAKARAWAARAALLSIVLLLVAGSLSGVFELAAAHGSYNAALFKAFGLESLALVPRTHSWYPTEFWFWWRGSRVIPGTITEFPFFSFLLGDLHPHVMSIPLVGLSVGLAASTWRGRSFLDFRAHRRPFIGLATVVVIGGLAFENAWDILTFSTVLVGAVLLRNWRVVPGRRAALAGARYLLPVFGLAVIAYAPWYVDFRSQAGGLYPYIGAGTRPAQAFLQFGLPLFAGLLAAVVAWHGSARGETVRVAPWTAGVVTAPFLAWLMLSAVRGDLGVALDARGSGGWLTLVIYGAGVWALFTAAMVRRREAIGMVAGLAAIGAFLLYGSELFFIRDVFFTAEPRFNTVFKLSYQAWLLLAVSGGIGLALIARALWTDGSRRGLLFAPAGLMVLGGLVYPATALPNRTDGFSHSQNTVDGFAFVARNDPDEYALTRWVEDNVPAGERIIEASGRAWRRDASGKLAIFDGGSDYTDASRISARTGQPTLVGWFFHEIQWRGDTPANRAELTRRQDILDNAYLSTTPDGVLKAMEDAGARYLVFGRVEQSRYPADALPRYDTFLDVVFAAGDLRVYALPSYEVISTS